MTELEGNGGDPNLQMQNTETLDQYFSRLLKAVQHMEYALKPDGHIFLALSNGVSGLGMLPKIAANTSLQLQTIRMWDYSASWDKIGNHTVLFAHFTKG